MFHDISTLKKSLFVWERVFRIVPSSYSPNDQTEIREAIANGTVVNLRLDRDEKSGPQIDFSNSIPNAISLGAH